MQVNLTCPFLFSYCIAWYVFRFVLIFMLIRAFHGMWDRVLFFRVIKCIKKCSRVIIKCSKIILETLLNFSGCVNPIKFYRYDIWVRQNRRPQPMGLEQKSWQFHWIILVNIKKQTTKLRKMQIVWQRKAVVCYNKVGKNYERCKNT